MGEVSGADRYRDQACSPRGEVLIVRVCLVDDNEAVLDAMALWLRDSNDEVVLARTGAEARSCVQEATPDLVIADVNLPDTTGICLARDLRTLRPGLVILLISGQAQLTAGAVGPDGADAFLMKPFTPKALTAAVRQAQQFRSDA